MKPDTVISDALSAHDTRATTYKVKFCPRVGTPDDVLDDAVLFCGLYDSRHRWGTEYMREIADEEFINMQLQFDTQMLQLDSQERVMVLELTSQRYTQSINDAIERISIATRGKQIDSERHRAAAREYAMAQDRRRVVTMQKVVDNALARASARIQTLTAEIQTLLVEGAMIEAEILQKNLEVERSKLAYLQAVQRGLQVQQDIADIGLRRARTEADIAKIESDVIQWDVRTAETASEIKELLARKKALEIQLAQVAVHELDAQADSAQMVYRKADIATQMIELQSQIDKINAQVATVAAHTEATYARTVGVSAQKAEVDVQIAQTQAEVQSLEADIIRADVDIARTRLSEADAVVSEAEAQIEERKSTQYWPQKAAASIERAAMYNQLSAEYASLIPLTQELSAQMVNLQAERYNLQVQEIKAGDKLYGIEVDARISENAIRANAAHSEAEAELEVGAAELRIWDSRRSSFIMANRGAIEAARILATANITNSLTHSIVGGR